MTSKPDGLRLLLVGSSGRMGSAITRAAESDASCVIAGHINSAEAQLPASADGLVVVDFSTDAGTSQAISIAAELKTPILIGTTALEQATIAAIDRVSMDIPVLLASNTSLGVAILEVLLKITSRILGDHSGIEVACTETHHAGKQDSPSGTAISLAKTVSENGLELPSTKIRSIRAGDVVGEHEICFENGLERLTLRHEALDRGLFAEGAIQMARLLLGRAPGRYQVADLLQFAETADEKC